MKITTKVTIFLTCLIAFVIFAVIFYPLATSADSSPVASLITTILMLISEFSMCWFGGSIAEDIYALQKKAGDLDDDT